MPASVPPVAADAEPRPDDLDGFFQVIDDRLVERPPMGPESTWIVNRMSYRLAAFVDAHASGTVVSEMLFALRRSPLLRRRPDVAIVSAGRWPLDRPIPREHGREVIPGLAVEVVGPSDPFEDVMGRIHDFVGAGAARARLVMPKLRRAYVSDGPAAIRVRGADDELDGGPTPPGFRCRVGAFFPPIASG